jgi:hypothetical protein
VGPRGIAHVGYCYFRGSNTDRCFAVGHDEHQRGSSLPLTFNLKSMPGWAPRAPPLLASVAYGVPTWIGASH